MMGETEGNPPPLTPSNRPWGALSAEIDEIFSCSALRLLLSLRLLLAATRLIVPGPRVRLSELWSLVRRSVGVDGGAMRLPLLSPYPPRYGRAAEVSMPPPASGTELSLAWQLLLRPMPGRWSDYSCPVSPRRTGSEPLAPMRP